MIIILATVTSCNKKEDDNNKITQIIMITEASEIELDMAGTGEVTINWGDGTNEAYTLSNNWKKPYSPLNPKIHEYSGASTHTITITGINITHLNCNSSELTDLDVSKNKTLVVLFCGYNQLMDLDVSKNTALTGLYCYHNQLTDLDVSKNSTLTDLRCFNNQLSNLDVSKNTALTDLYCDTNQLTDLDVSKNTTLTDLYCYTNQLKDLDVSKNTMLTYLHCGSNQLMNLDVTKNTKLTYLYCSYNLLSKDALDALFGTLHSNIIDRKALSINDNPGTDSCDQSIATDKGWSFW